MGANASSNSARDVSGPDAHRAFITSSSLSGKRLIPITYFKCSSYLHTTLEVDECQEKRRKFYDRDRPFLHT